MPTTISTEVRQKIGAVRTQLLDFHKLLMDQERARYEEAHGPIRSTGEYLELVLSHSQFEWLRQLSGLIVQIDEMLAPRSTAGTAEAEAVLREIRNLMSEAAEGNFAGNLRESIRQSVPAGTAHLAILRSLAQ